MAVRYGGAFLLFTFWINYIIYPSWAVPELEWRGFFLMGLMAYSGLMYVVLLFVIRYLKLSENEKIIDGNSVSIPFPLFGILAFFGVLHLYFSLFPVAPIDDRLYHVYAPLRLFEYVLPAIENAVGLNPWFLIQLVFFSCIAVMVWIAKRYGFRNLNQKKHALLLLLGLCVLAWLEYLMLSGFVLPEGLHRFPPLGKLFYLLSYLTFGLNEFAAQFWTVIFLIASGWVFYRLIRLRFSDVYAVGGVAVFLALPVVFFYGNSPELDCATLFFLLAAVYLYQKYRLNRNELFLFLVSMFLSVGFLYKRYVLALAIIIAVDIMFDLMREKKLTVRPFITLFLPVGMIAFPWLVLGKMYAIRNYQFSIDNVINTIPGYWDLFVQEFSYFGAFFVVLSLILGLVVRRDEFSRFMALWLVGYLTFFAADFPYPVDRFSLLVMPPLVYFMVVSIEAVFTENQGKYIFGGAAIVFLGMSTFIKIPSVSAEYRAWGFAHELPRYDLALDHLGRLPSAKFLDFGRPNGLYLLRNGLWPYVHNTTQVRKTQNVRLWWNENPEQSLWDFIVSHEIKYMVLPDEKYRHLYPEEFVVWVSKELENLRQTGMIFLSQEFGSGKAKVLIYEIVEPLKEKKI